MTTRAEEEGPYLHSLDGDVDQVLDGCAEGQGKDELLRGSATAVDHEPHEVGEGEGLEAVEGREAPAEGAPGHEVEGAEVEEPPAGGIQGGAPPALADEGHREGEVVEGEPAEDIDQAVHLHLLPPSSGLHVEP